jgi:hypothetical protein
MIVCLSRSFDGPSLKKSYAIDPITGRELEIGVDSMVTLEDLEAIYKYERVPDGAIAAAFDQILPVAMENSYEKEKNKVFTEAVDYVFKNCGAAKGEILPPEHKKRLIGLIMEKLEPFIIHQTTPMRRTPGL